MGIRISVLTLGLMAAFAVSACGDSGNTAVDNGAADVENDVSDDSVADSLSDSGPDSTATDAVVDSTDTTPEPWPTNFEPGLEVVNGLRILHLKGSGYEMGRQHATLMKNELLDGVYYLENSELGLLEPLAAGFGFIDEAMVNSYPDSKDECQGMADVAGDDGWTMNRCIALAYGEVVLDWQESGLLTSCSQFAVAGPATKDGKLLHGRNLDWDAIEYLLKYPTVIVRHPTGEIPYVVVGFPGNVAAYNGINAAGITVATNENGSTNDLDREGQPHAQMVNYILSHFSTLNEVINYVTTANHMSSENMMVTSGREGRAVIFEMTATHLYYEELGEDGLVYITNHFTVDSMKPYEDSKDPSASTFSRYMRLEQLLTPDGKDTIYGNVDLAGAVSVLRDRYNPITDVTHPADAFDDGGAIAVNGAIYSIVFRPGEGEFWFAYGDVPIPSNPYRGFSLQQLFGNEPDAVVEPPVVE